MKDGWNWNVWQSTMKDITLGNLIGNISGTYGKERGHPGQISSYISKKETPARWGYPRSSRLFDGIFIERFTDQKENQVFH